MVRRARVDKVKRSKKVNVALIKPETNFGGYKIMAELIEQHHTHLTDAKIALAWMYGKKSDVDGRLVLGRAKKGSDLDRDMHGFDFVILLNHEAYTAASFTKGQQTALLDHELTHCEVSKDTNGEPKTDERGRTVYRMRGHDVEEFREVVARHGTWKSDLEGFAQAALQNGDKNRPLLKDLEEHGTNGNGKRPERKKVKAK